MSNPYTKALFEGKCEVVFTKTDGSTRTMTCTLNPDMIPEDMKPTGTSDKKTSTQVQPVYDIEKNGWRSFLIANVKSFRSL